MRSTVKGCLTRTCVRFTVYSILFMLLQELIGTGDYRINITSFLLLFPAALCISAADEILRADRLSSAARRVLHFVIALLALFLFVILPAVGRLSFPTVLILLAILAGIYWLWYLLTRVLGNR